MSKTFRPARPKSQTGIEGTWSKNKKGEYIFKVRLTAIPPFGVKTRNILMLWLPILGMIYQAMVLLQYESVPFASWAQHLLTPWLLYPASYIVFSWLFRSSSVVEMTANEISINTGSGWQSYPRNVHHEFKAISHDKEVAENDKRMPPKKRYYKKSRIVTLFHGGTEVAILDVFDARKAERMVSQLKADEDWLEGTAQRGKGISPIPQSGFSLQPGSLNPVAPTIPSGN